MSVAFCIMPNCRNAAPAGDAFCSRHRDAVAMMDNKPRPKVTFDLARPAAGSRRSRPWEIAADLEKAWMAVHDAEVALDAIHASAIAEVEAIPGTQFVNSDMVSALRALSDKYQAIADAQEEI